MSKEACFFCLRQAKNQKVNDPSAYVNVTSESFGFQLFCKFLNLDAHGWETIVFCESCSPHLYNLQNLIGIYNQVKADIEDCINEISSCFSYEIPSQHSIHNFIQDLRSETISKLMSLILDWNNLNKDKLKECYQEIHYVPVQNQNQGESVADSLLEEIEVKPEVEIKPWASENSAHAIKIEPVLPDVSPGNSETEVMEPILRPKNVRLNQRLKQKSQSFPLAKVVKAPTANRRKLETDPEIKTRLRPRRNSSNKLNQSVHGEDEEFQPDWASDPESSDSEDSLTVEPAGESKSPRKRIRKNCSILSTKYRRKDGKLYYEGVQFLESGTEWTCTLCDEKFPRIKNHKKLFKHIDKHNGILRYKCPESNCGKGYSTPGGLRKHRKTSHGTSKILNTQKSHKCSICGKPYKDLDKANAHEKWIHMNRQEYDNAIITLGKTPPKTVSKLMHWMQSSSKAPGGPKSYQCATCGLAYAKPYNLKQHEESTHGGLGIESYKCCGKEFKGKRKYQIHYYRTHKISINNKCQYCGKCVHNKSTLIRHLKQVHNEFGGKNFTCHLCPFRAASKSRLQMHLDCHGTEKKFKCEYCDMAFKLNWTLKRHRMVIHKDQLNNDQDS